MVTVRPATIADAPAMGQLVVRPGRPPTGQMPDDYLNASGPRSGRPIGTACSGARIAAA